MFFILGEYHKVRFISLQSRELQLYVKKHVLFELFVSLVLGEERQSLIQDKIIKLIFFILICFHHRKIILKDNFKSICANSQT